MPSVILFSLMQALQYATSGCDAVPGSLTVQISEQSHIFQLIVRSMLVWALGIPAAASDVIGAKGPMGIQLVTEGSGCQRQPRNCFICVSQPAGAVVLFSACKIAHGAKVPLDWIPEAFVGQHSRHALELTI